MSTFGQGLKCCVCNKTQWYHGKSPDTWATLDCIAYSEGWRTLRRLNEAYVVARFCSIDCEHSEQGQKIILESWAKELIKNFINSKWNAFFDLVLGR